MRYRIACSWTRGGSRNGILCARDFRVTDTGNAYRGSIVLLFLCFSSPEEKELGAYLPNTFRRSREGRTKRNILFRYIPDRPAVGRVRERTLLRRRSGTTVRSPSPTGILYCVYIPPTLQPFRSLILPDNRTNLVGLYIYICIIYVCACVRYIICAGTKIKHVIPTNCLQTIYITTGYRCRRRRRHHHHNRPLGTSNFSIYM